jgi:hypothetical protein
MLQAYHDGELGFLARRRVERQLAASAEAREALRGLARVGELVRESQAELAAPDLWASIARQLPAAPAPAEARGLADALSDALGRLFLPAGAALAAAAAAAAAFFVLSGGEPAGVADVVQYLDPGDNSVMLLQGEDEATIIWVMEPVATDTSSRESRAII